MVLLVLVRWLHLLAALFWVGGQLFLLSVILPVLRAQLPRADQLRLIAAAGRRFAVYSLAALGVLITTGLYLAFAHGLSFQGLAGDTWEQVLLVKVVLVVAVIPITAVHSAIYGGHLERLGVATDPNPALQAERLRVQRRSRVLSSATLVLSLIIVAFAAWLASLG
ncbi:MAG: CopD family protein [Chloroflexi bacterium]|nr:CopD family protein [Chloroflexota bacterium]